MRRAWIGLGANLGERRRTLETAITWMRATPNLEVEAVSRVRETPPMGPPQPAYLNAVVRIRTTLAPLELLEMTQGFERAAGRVKGERWGPRPLDLDILLLEDLQYHSPTLTIPHPGIASRRFVLEPLCDLNPAFRHPVLDRPLSDLLEALPVC